MRLLNPFLNEPSHQPTVTRIPSHDVYNPGPGLPHATIPTYSYTAPPSTSNFLNRNFSGSGNSPFFCDRCDRSFRSQELLDIHISEHITCGIEGCPFMAHPKIVEMHVQMQHRTGMASMIMNLTSPEDIQKWREERKKNFPSSTNIARRQAAQKEKLDRGEVLYEPKKRLERKGKKKQREQTRNDKGKRPDESKNITSCKAMPNLGKKENVFCQDEISFKKTEIKTATERVLSDGEIDSEAESKCTSPVNALSNFMDCYMSEGETELAAPAVKKIKVEPIPIEHPKEKKDKPRRQQNRKKNKGRESQNRNEIESDGKKSQAIAQSIHPKRLTLLQKLLEKEIIHERNVVLQCVHYIVQQNFFGIGQKTNDKAHIATHQSNTVSRCAYFI